MEQTRRVKGRTCGIKITGNYLYYILEIDYMSIHYPKGSEWRKWDLHLFFLKNVLVYLLCLNDKNKEIEGQ